MTREQPLTEFELIRKYFTRPTRNAVLGVGDDAAVLAVRPGFQLAASTDMMVEGTHFFPEVDPHALGHKALAVNLSDMAAMGAIPKWALLSIALPNVDDGWLAKFSRGFFTLAERLEVELVGGDTTRGPLNLCVQIMGEVEAGLALRRDAARIGDDVWVSGQLGEAALAVAHLQSRILLPDAIADRCRLRLDRPEPRVALGRALIGCAHAAVDISDGLLADLGHICERSGVGAVIDFDALPCSPDIWPLRDQEEVARALLAGGDDYELCFTAPENGREKITKLAVREGLALTRVGFIEEGTEVTVRGRTLAGKEKGFDHFR
ncbi:MAG: thiamine-phosphate kinase [Burkholderiales bacterium]